MLFNVVRNPMFWRPLMLQKRLLPCAVRSTTNVVQASPSAVQASADAVPLSFSEKKEKLLAELNADMPKPYDGPERDLVNYPRRVRADYPGKVRFGILPDEWFTFFYKKTGVTGPYLFYGGLITFLLSKELYVIEDEFSSAVAIFTLIYIAIKKFGPQTRAYGEKLFNDQLGSYNKTKAEAIKFLQEDIENEKKAQWQTGVAELIIAAKKENVMMQLETEYRRRLTDVYQQVKKRLDYHLDLDNTRRKLEQRHMVEWIVSNVMKSITPQQEKEALQKCLSDLKALSARA